MVKKNEGLEVSRCNFLIDVPIGSTAFAARFARVKAASPMPLAVRNCEIAPERQRRNSAERLKTRFGHLNKERE
jgi:hypothetical protein